MDGLDLVLGHHNSYQNYNSHSQRHCDHYHQQREFKSELMNNDSDSNSNNTSNSNINGNVQSNNSSIGDQEPAAVERLVNDSPQPLQSESQAFSGQSEIELSSTIISENNEDVGCARSGASLLNYDEGHDGGGGGVGSDQNSRLCEQVTNDEQYSQEFSNSNSNSNNNSNSISDDDNKSISDSHRQQQQHCETQAATTTQLVEDDNNQSACQQLELASSNTTNQQQQQQQQVDCEQLDDGEQQMSDDDAFIAFCADSSSVLNNDLMSDRRYHINKLYQPLDTGPGGHQDKQDDEYLLYQELRFIESSLCGLGGSDNDTLGQTELLLDDHHHTGCVNGDVDHGGGGDDDPLDSLQLTNIIESFVDAADSAGGGTDDLFASEPQLTTSPDKPDSSGRGNECSPVGDYIAACGGGGLINDYIDSNTVANYQHGSMIECHEQQHQAGTCYATQHEPISQRESYLFQPEQHQHQHQDAANYCNGGDGLQINYDELQDKYCDNKLLNSVGQQQQHETQSDSVLISSSATNSGDLLPSSEVISSGEVAAGGNNRSKKRSVECAQAETTSMMMNCSKPKKKTKAKKNEVTASGRDSASNASNEENRSASGSVVVVVAQHQQHQESEQMASTSATTTSTKASGLKVSAKKFDELDQQDSRNDSRQDDYDEEYDDDDAMFSDDNSMRSSDNGGGARRKPIVNHYRRRTANARERIRMREINKAFEKLKKVVPVELIRQSASEQAASSDSNSNHHATSTGRRHGKSSNNNNQQQQPSCDSVKLTKITTLRLAVSYIAKLTQLLNEQPATSGGAADSGTSISTTGPAAVVGNSKKRAKAARGGGHKSKRCKTTTTTVAAARDKIEASKNGSESAINVTQSSMVVTGEREQSGLCERGESRQLVAESNQQQVIVQGPTANSIMQIQSQVQVQDQQQHQQQQPILITNALFNGAQDQQHQQQHQATFIAIPSQYQNHSSHKVHLQQQPQQQQQLQQQQPQQQQQLLISSQHSFSTNRADSRTLMTPVAVAILGIPTQATTANVSQADQYQHHNQASSSESISAGVTPAPAIQLLGIQGAQMIKNGMQIAQSHQQSRPAATYNLQLAQQHQQHQQHKHQQQVTLTLDDLNGLSVLRLATPGQSTEAGSVGVGAKYQLIQQNTGQGRISHFAYAPVQQLAAPGNSYQHQASQQQQQQQQICNNNHQISNNTINNNNNNLISQNCNNYASVNVINSNNFNNNNNGNNNNSNAQQQQQVASFQEERTIVCNIGPQQQQQQQAMQSANCIPTSTVTGIKSEQMNNYNSGISAQSATIQSIASNTNQTLVNRLQPEQFLTTTIGQMASQVPISIQQNHNNQQQQQLQQTTQAATAIFCSSNSSNNVQQLFQSQCVNSVVDGGGQHNALLQMAPSNGQKTPNIVYINHARPSSNMPQQVCLMSTSGSPAGAITQQQLNGIDGLPHVTDISVNRNKPPSSSPSVNQVNFVNQSFSAQATSNQKRRNQQQQQQQAQIISRESNIDHLVASLATSIQPDIKLQQDTGTASGQAQQSGSLANSLHQQHHQQQQQQKQHDQRQQQQVSHHNQPQQQQQPPMRTYRFHNYDGNMITNHLYSNNNHHNHGNSSSGSDKRAAAAAAAETIAASKSGAATTANEQQASSSSSRHQSANSIVVSQRSRQNSLSSICSTTSLTSTSASSSLNSTPSTSNGGSPPAPASVVSIMVDASAALEHNQKSSGAGSQLMLERSGSNTTPILIDHDTDSHGPSSELANS